jgi:hypothetical protein
MLMVMTSFSTPSITSFIIRFVHENQQEDGKLQPLYRGFIRHIQSDEELNFSSWKEAESFIRRFVALEEEPS